MFILGQSYTYNQRTALKNLELLTKIIVYFLIIFKKKKIASDKYLCMLLNLMPL